MRVVRTPFAAAIAAGLLLLTGCNSGTGNPPGFEAGGDFRALRASPSGGAEAKLNDPITIDFTNPVDLASADLNTVQFQVFDLSGNPLQEQVTGTFSRGTATGDDEPGRRLVFRPSFPTNDTYDNGGLRPARRYTVTLSSGDAESGTVLTDVRPRGLLDEFSFTFRTPESTEISQLFRDTRGGGPRIESVEASPRNADDRVFVGEFSKAPVEVRIEFDQPLDPASTNLPLTISPDPVIREQQNRGRVFLQYDDPDFGAEQWVAATVELESNTNDGSVIVLRPIGILPNNAEIEVVVDRALRDLGGQSNLTNPAFQPIVATFETEQAFEPQFDAIVENFATDEFVDDGAVFLEPIADVQNGKIRASFAFEGNETVRIYQPTDQTVTLNTSQTVVTPVGLPPFNVIGGVFRFREVTIPLGVTVRGTGPNPMVWLVNGDFTINGTLSVQGGPGQDTNSLQSPQIATAGGISVCGGGNGGLGSPNTTSRSQRGQDGFGPFQTPGGGGSGGRIGCAGTNCGSGGGGGAFRSQGDPFYPPPTSGGALPAQWDSATTGRGGGNLNCSPSPGGSSPLGGEPGPLAFTDSRADNDFLGTGVNIFERVRIQGELLAPRGGSGGGGGGDQCVSSGNFANDRKGAGGGAGGGALIINALGRITIGPDGRILANGGTGGGGEQAGSNEFGGGGGAGSGGMVVLISGTGIDIFRDAGYADREFDFAIRADGESGRQGEFSPPVISGKYFNGQVGSVNWGNREIGGFGGNGLIQLQTPPGDDLDGTGNRLDDNIRFFDPISGDLLPDSEKVRLLAWRGWPSSAPSVEGIDDLGNPIDIGRNAGAVRPTPVLLPATFGSLSRARSKWIDLGAARRRQSTTTPSGLDPRVVVVGPQDLPAPDFSFAGTITSGDPADFGYADFEVAGVAADIDFPVRASGDVAGTQTGLSVDGRDAFAIDFVPGTLAGVEDDRFSNHRLELLEADGDSLAEFRILSHTGDRVLVAAGNPLPAVGQIDSARVLAKFFAITTDGQPGLGPTIVKDFQTGERAPIANVRIGFAFTTDPTDPSAPRWPDPAVEGFGSFEFDIDLDNNAGLRDFLDQNRPSFVQWDVLFDRQFTPGSTLSRDLPFPELEFLVLPLRY